MGVVNTSVLGSYKHGRFQAPWWTAFDGCCKHPSSEVLQTWSFSGSLVDSFSSLQFRKGEDIASGT